MELMSLNPFETRRRSPHVVPTWVACLGVALAQSTTGCGSTARSCGPGTRDDGAECIATPLAAGGATGAGGSPTGGTAGAAAESGGSAGTSGCLQPLAFFRDADGDGYGAGQAVAACASPGSGWVSQPGDCDDELASVHPGVTDYFEKPYALGGVDVSFDYNCDGNEEPDPSLSTVTSFGMCAGVYPSCPKGFGYFPLDPAHPDAYCGSRKTLECGVNVYSMCMGYVDENAPAFRCH